MCEAEPVAYRRYWTSSEYNNIIIVMSEALF